MGYHQHSNLLKPRRLEKQKDWPRPESNGWPWGLESHVLPLNYEALKTVLLKLYIGIKHLNYSFAVMDDLFRPHTFTSSPHSRATAIYPLNFAEIIVTSGAVMTITKFWVFYWIFVKSPSLTNFDLCAQKDLRYYTPKTAAQGNYFVVK